MNFSINVLRFRFLSYTKPILLLLILAGFLSSCQTQTKIISSVSIRDANEIVVLLNSKGITAVKSPTVTSAVGGATATAQMWDISVPSIQITEALGILNQSGLPRTRGTTLLDLFGSQGLVPSDMQDRIRYQEGLSEQIASTIRKMDGVLDADVQISFPRDEESTCPLTASVFIKYQGVLDNILVTKIKRLIASAVPCLTPDNVSVVSDRAILSDINLAKLDTTCEQPFDYVSIWSIVIAKESATRFQVIFYIFILLLFILACALAWTLWKFAPIIKEKGGRKMFFKPEQVHLEPKTIIEEEVEEIEENEP